jgi:hypothetical protein
MRSRDQQPDLSFCIVHKQVGNTHASIACGDVDLFNLIADDHGEARDPTADHSDGRVADSLCGPDPEGVLLSSGDQLRGHVPEVAVPPAEVPDRRDRRRVLR